MISQEIDSNILMKEQQCCRAITSLHHMLCRFTEILNVINLLKYLCVV